MGLKLTVRVCRNQALDYIDVRAGFVGDEFSNSVHNLVKRDNITVGLREDGHPVYIRIRGADALSDTFAACALCLKNKIHPHAALRKKINMECISMMQELANAYSAKVLRESLKNVKYEFSTETECAPA